MNQQMIGTELSEKKPHCGFYVKSKQRFCKFPISGPHGFCYSHSVNNESNRCLCPIDNKHSIYNHKLLSHLPHCTRTRDIAFELSQPFVYEGINETISLIPKSHLTPDNILMKQQRGVDTLTPNTPYSKLYTHAGACTPLKTYDTYILQLQQQFKQQILQTNTSHFFDSFSFDKIDHENDDMLQLLHNQINDIYLKGCQSVHLQPNEFIESVTQSSFKQSRIHSYHKNTLPTSITNQPLPYVQQDNTQLNILESTTPFSNMWKTSLEFQDIVKKAVKAQSHEDFTVPNENPSELPVMDKHAIQNASLLAICIQLNYLTLKGTSSINKSLCIEFGAGRGALTRWFVLTNSYNKLLDFKFVLIDREKRRNQAEGKNEELLVDRETIDSTILRLRLDIRDFNLYALLGHILGIDHGQTSSNSIPRLLQFLHYYGVIDLPISQEDIQYKLKQLAKGNRDKINHLHYQVSNYFTPSWFCASNHSHEKCFPPEKNVLCIAKHLCGDATDSAFRCIINGILRLKANNTYKKVNTRDNKMKINIAIAPCCHHRCTWDSTLNKEFFLSIGISEKNFDKFVKLSGWGTGATGIKQLIGIKVKRIIDMSRILWLQTNGFSNANLLLFVPGLPVTLENVVIVGSQ